MRRHVLTLAFGLFFAIAGATVLHAMANHYGYASASGGNVYCGGFMDAAEEYNTTRAVTVYLWGPNNEGLAADGLRDTAGHHLEVYVQHASIGSGWYRCQIAYEETVYPEDTEYDEENYWVYVS